MRLTRRQILGGAAACLAGCGKRGTTPTGDTGGCSAASTGSTPQYCLVTAVVVRVRGAANLAVGEAVLANLDDNTAVIVARDADGLHAMSAICTHACCIVALCGDAACSSLTPTPGACESTDVLAAPGILCPCHGSTFAISDGAALTGPATTALPSYSLELAGADVLVDTGTLVDPAVRA